MTYHRKFLFGLLALVFLLFCTQTPGQHAKEVKEKVKNATVYVQTDIINNWGGSGFFVAPDKIVTNIHVLAGKPDIFISVVGPKTTYHIEGVVGFDPKHDLVILQVEPEGTPLRLGKGKIGDQIFAAGYPAVAYEDEQRQSKKKYKREYKDDSEGTIRNIWNEGKQLELPFSFLTSGNSGGPIVNLKGEVVGIAVTGQEVDSKTPAFSGAVSTLVLKELIDKSKSVEPMSLSGWQEESCVLAYVSSKKGKDKMKEAELKEAAEREQLYGEASEYFDKANELCSNYADAHLGLGKARLSLDEFKAAIDAFTEVIELNPDDYIAYFYNGVAHLKLGELEDNEGNAEEARRHYNAAINDFSEGIRRIKVTEKAQGLYNEVLHDLNETYYTNRAAAKFRLGQLETDQERSVTLYHEAINDLTEAIKLDPADAASHKNRAVAKFRLGQLKDNQGDTEKAQGFYNEVLHDLAEAAKLNPDVINDFDPKLVNAYDYYTRGGVEIILGQSKAKQGNREKALEHYQKAFKYYEEAVNLDPDNADNYYGYVIGMLDPVSADTYNVRGGMRAILGEYKADQGDTEAARQHYNAAINDFNEAIEQNWENTSVHTNRGYTNYLLGRSYEAGATKEDTERARNLYEEAIADSNNAIRLNSESAIAYRVRGSSEAALENYSKAIADLHRAIELNLNFAEAYWERGLVYQKIGQQTEAEADFKKAKELDPNLGK